MRKIISVMLALFICACAVPTLAEDAQVNTLLVSSGWRYSDDGKVIVEAVAKNVSGATNNYMTVYAIGYDENGSAVEVGCKDHPAERNENCNYYITLYQGNLIKNVEIFTGDLSDDIEILAAGAYCLKSDYYDRDMLKVTAVCENGQDRYINMCNVTAIGYNKNGEVVSTETANMSFYSGETETFSIFLDEPSQIASVEVIDDNMRRYPVTIKGTIPGAPTATAKPTSTPGVTVEPSAAPDGTAEPGEPSTTPGVIAEPGDPSAAPGETTEPSVAPDETAEPGEPSATPGETGAPEQSAVPEEYPYAITDFTLQTETGDTLDAPPENKSFIARVSCAKTLERDPEDYLFVAVYGADGTLLSLDYVQANFARQSDFAIGFHIAAQKEKIGAIKASVWDGLKSMKPLCMAAEMEFE